MDADGWGLHNEDCLESVNSLMNERLAALDRAVGRLWPRWTELLDDCPTLDKS